MDAKMHVTHDELTRRFNYHQPPDQETIDRHARVRDACQTAAETIVEVTGPPTREQATALTKLEEAMFWANAAVARPRG